VSHGAENPSRPAASVSGMSARGSNGVVPFNRRLFASNPSPPCARVCGSICELGRIKNETKSTL
jgi:hypothetical protein